MTSPSNPSEVTVIRKVTENITTFSAPFRRFGQVKIGGRSTAVRMQSGGVAVFPSTALTDEVKATVTSMGEVKYLAALDMEHHIHLGSWAQAFPAAKVIGPEGLEQKRARMQVEPVELDHVVREHGHLYPSIDAEFDAEFDHTFVWSHPNKELVFNFRRERTLIEADLLFNLPAIEQYSKSPENPHSGVLTRFFNKMNNTTYGSEWQQRFIWYAISAGDRTGFNRSIARIYEMDFDRIIPCHGDVIESSGKGIFRKIMAWHLDAARKDPKI